MAQPITPALTSRLSWPAAAVILGWLLILLVAGALWLLGGWLPQYFVVLGWTFAAAFLTLVGRHLTGRPIARTPTIARVALLTLSTALLIPMTPMLFAAGWALSGLLIFSTTVYAIRDLTRQVPAPGSA